MSLESKNISRVLLGVNVDHVATLRQARETRYPDPVMAALIAEQSGADGITIHVREDRRHVQERDLQLLQQMTQTRVNLELAVTEEMILMAEKYQPAHCCLVPEKREELTTEGGLNVLENQQQVTDACTRLANAGIEVSLFIDADPAQIQAAKACGAAAIELHTGSYADAISEATQQLELEKIRQGVRLGLQQGLVVNGGHGLNYQNVQAVAAIEGISELNIGHAIIAQSVFDGLEKAVIKMKSLIDQVACGTAIS